MAEAANRRLAWLNSIENRTQASRARHYASGAAAISRSAVESFLRNDDLLRAAALTYTVALSIVPILALAFSALKGFGGYDHIRPLVDRYLAPGSPQTADQLMNYVDHTNAAAIGTAGAAFLLFTVISTMGTIEQAFNQIWRVTRSRSLLRKFTDYLSVLFTVPLLMVAALTMTAMFTAHVSRMPVVAGVMPYLMVWTGFFLLYVFFPYTHVSYTAAAAGSFIAAVLFQLGQWAYVTFQIGMANYQAIYGALAAVPIFLVWIYIAWSIVLFGAEVSVAIQRGARRSALAPNTSDFVYIATFHILLRLADRHLRGSRPITVRSLAAELGVDQGALTPIIDRLEKRGFVIEAGGEPKTSRHQLILNRAPAMIRLSEAVGTTTAGKAEAAVDPRIRELLNRLSALHHNLLGTLTLADLTEQPPAQEHPVAAPAAKP
jgi:membrane protein